MFLRAGALSLALLLASRLLGVARESALAAAFGRSALADVAVLALTLPDWLASVMAAGALAYVLLPAWAGQPAPAVAALQRRVALWLVGGAAVIALALVLLRYPVLDVLAAGVPGPVRPLAGAALAWSAAALPLALLAALWVTRAQHERDFTGMYGANLVVNAVLIATIAIAGWSGASAVPVLGLGLLAAMAARLAWLKLRAPSVAPSPDAVPLPRLPLWIWAALAAGLPLALPFAARSAASQGGVGALATFNYAWKLVELPQILAIQLVASLAFPAIAAAVREARDRSRAVRQAMLLAWTLACGAVGALAVGGAALARLLFGWGRMDAGALGQVAHWGVAGSWGLLPQALAAVALTVLAAQERMRPAVLAYAVAFAGLLVAAAAGVADGAWLMQVLNAGFTLVAVVGVLAMREAAAEVPWAAMAAPAAVLAVVAAASAGLQSGWGGNGSPASLVAALFAGAAPLAAAWWRSAELREALRR